MTMSNDIVSYQRWIIYGKYKVEMKILRKICKRYEAKIIEANAPEPHPYAGAIPPKMPISRFMGILKKRPDDIRQVCKFEI